MSGFQTGILMGDPRKSELSKGVVLGQNRANG